MSKFIKIGNQYISKKSILSVESDKTIFGKNIVKITTSEKYGFWIFGSGGIGQNIYDIQVDEKVDIVNYVNDIINEINNE